MPVTPLTTRIQPHWRLAVAVALSLLLHAALLLSFQVGQIERPGEPVRRLQVRLADADSPAVARKEEPQPVLIRDINKPEPLPKPAEPSQARPEPAELPPQSRPQEARPGMTEQAAGATTLDMPLPADPTYYPARQVDEHPVLVSGGKPVYPEKAGKDNVEGEVTVLILLNEHGAADEISIVDAKPEGMGFEQAVVAWLQDARFKPALRKDRAVKSRVVYRVTFDSEQVPMDRKAKGGRR